MRLALALAAAATLAACAHAADAPDVRAAEGTAKPPAGQPETPAPGDPVDVVRSYLGPSLEERAISPTERILSGVHDLNCQQPAGRPQDLSMPPCGVAQPIAFRIREGRVVEVLWGDRAR